MEKNEVFQNNDERIECEWWLGLLEAGLLPKGRGMLQRKREYCCLGVACVLLIEPDRLRQDGNRLYGVNTTSQPFSPKWLDRLQDYLVSNNFISLVSMNDGFGAIHGYSHPEIAAQIREIFADELIER